MTTRLLPSLALAVLVGAPLAAQQLPGLSSRAVAGDQDWSWYPHEVRPGFVGEGVVDEDARDVVHAGNAVFRVGHVPAVPRELRKPLRVDGVLQPGWFIAHFDGGVGREHKALLDALCGPTRRPDGTALARWYAPHDTVGVWVEDEATLAALRSLADVDWVGRYQPAWKLSPSIGRAPLSDPERVGRGFYRLHLELVPGAPVEPVVDALHALGVLVLDHVYLRGKREFDVSFLAVDALPQDVTRIAWIEGVRYVLEAGDGKQLWDLSGGGKLQARTLAADNGGASPIVNATTFPLWVTHDLQGQGQLIGVVDTALDWNNTGVTGCDNWHPDTSINKYGFANPKTSTLLIPNPIGDGMNKKIPLVDLLSGAEALGYVENPAMDREHGAGVAGAALADFYANNDNKWWEHDVDEWESWAPKSFSGLLGPGIAHEAQLYFTPVDHNNAPFPDNFAWNIAGVFESNMLTTLENMDAFGAASSVHSTGIVESMNTYTMLSVVHDQVAYDCPMLLQCMAAGNCGEGVVPQYCGEDEADQLTSQAVVKNALTVGASDDVLQPENRANFSSAGPAFDGRIKPDVLAPGTDFFPRFLGQPSQLILPDNNGSSTDSCAYQFTSGTSFSAPIAAGAVALIHQYFEEGRYAGSQSITDPSAALMKAMMINSGHRLTGANLFGGDYPDGYQGWGEPVLLDVLDLPGEARDLMARDVGSLAGLSDNNDPVQTYAVRVDSSSEPLRVTLAWTDEPGSAGSAKKLVNNLNLRVTDPFGQTYLGNDFHPSAGFSTTGGNVDTKNNVENAFFANPAVGDWLIKVDAGNGSFAAGQGYGLAATGALTEISDPQSWFFVFKSTTNVPGVGNVANEDVVFFDGATGTWALHMDGSDLGLAPTKIDGLHVRDDGDLLISIANASKEVPGLVGGPNGNTVTDSDILHVDITTSGANTTGTVNFHFEGADVGLVEGSEDVDAIYEWPNGELVVSVTGVGAVPGVSVFRDEDLLQFQPTSLGATTAGTWTQIFDGSDLDMTKQGEDIDGVTLSGGSDFYLSTTGNLKASSVSAVDEDVSFWSGTFGTNPTGFFSLELDLSAMGIDGSEELNALSRIR